MLLTFLQKIPDFRRSQSKHFILADMLLVVIIGVIGGSKSYRELESYIRINFKKLNELLGLGWQRIPDYSTIRNIMIGCNSEELEKVLRGYSEWLVLQNHEEKDIITAAIDGKTMRGSFDHMKEQKAFHILSVYLTDVKIVVGHEVVKTDKTNEIPMAQKLIEELNLIGVVYTLDALHCQKKQ